jgi:hypothetical protein
VVGFGMVGFERTSLETLTSFMIARLSQSELGAEGLFDLRITYPKAGGRD